MKRDTQKRTGKVQPGDVIEISTQEGFRYVQVTHVHSEYGPLVRALPGSKKARPADIEAFLETEEQFVTFAYIDYALRKDPAFSLIGNYPVPARCSEFPLFRARVGLTRDGSPRCWKLWDGQNSEQLERLMPEHYDLPIQGILSHELLVYYMETGWKHRDLLR